MREIRCNAMNHGGLRGVPVRHIVVHYTGTPGDTAENEGLYFSRNDTQKTSAHYFVDEHEVIRSVPEEYVAYHCGGMFYYHDSCRNSNSIGVEICTKGENGTYWFAPQALEQAKALILSLMQRYRVPPERVLRHYDVTGKLCPMPFVGKGQSAWETFKGGLTVYETLEAVPSWAQETIRKLCERGVLAGDGNGLNLSHDLVRTLVILDRAQVFEKEE